MGGGADVSSACSCAAVQVHDTFIKINAKVLFIRSASDGQVLVVFLWQKVPVSGPSPVPARPGSHREQRWEALGRARCYSDRAL